MQTSSVNSVKTWTANKWTRMRQHTLITLGFHKIIGFIEWLSDYTIFVEEHCGCFSFSCSYLVRYQQEVRY